MSLRLRTVGITPQRVASALGRTGAWYMLHRTVPWDGVLCLNYHRVGDGSGSMFDHGLWSADSDAFGEQLKFLKAHFDVVSPPDLPDVLRGGKGRYVLITFDDGYLDNYSTAFPILQHHGIVATFFVTTGFLDAPRISWWDEVAWMVRTSSKHNVKGGPWFSTPVTFDEPDRERAIQALLTTYKQLPAHSGAGYLAFLADETGSGRYPSSEGQPTWMTWEMLRRMRDAGMVVGGHTISHPVLAQLSPERQWEEISGCGQRLAQELGGPMRYFSYPIGKRYAFDSHTRACLQKAGVQYAFSYYGGIRTFDQWDDFDVRRVAVESDMTLDWIRAIVTLPGLFARTG